LEIDLYDPTGTLAGADRVNAKVSFDAHDVKVNYHDERATSVPRGWDPKTQRLNVEVVPSNNIRNGYVAWSDNDGSLQVDLVKLAAIVHKYEKEWRKAGYTCEEDAFKAILTYTLKHEILIHYSGYGNPKRRGTYKIDTYEDVPNFRDTGKPYRSKGYLDSGAVDDYFNKAIKYVSPDHQFWLDHPGLQKPN
jgi:hypothetical protein